MRKGGREPVAAAVFQELCRGRLRVPVALCQQVVLAKSGFTRSFVLLGGKIALVGIGIDFGKEGKFGKGRDLLLATSKKPNTVEVVTALAKPVVEQMGLQLWDVRFEKEGASWYLRIFIDKEGGVTIDDCENLSRAMDQILDDADPISQSYYFEVSSPGIGRDLVRPWHFQRYLGQDVQVKLIRPVKTQDGKNLREFVAPMTGCDDQTVTVELEGEPFSFSKKDAAYIRLYEEIDWKSGR